MVGIAMAVSLLLYHSVKFHISMRFEWLCQLVPYLERRYPPLNPLFSSLTFYLNHI